MPASTPDPVAESPGLAALVRDFVRLDRRRLLRDPALTPDDLGHLRELHDRIEEASGAIRPTGGERRQTLRVRTRLQVQVTWDAARKLVRAHGLSEGGLFLQTSHPSTPGTEVELELQDLRGRPLHLEGTVVWSRLESEEAGLPGMGIRFRNLDDWDRVLLAELVEAALHAL